MKRRPDFFLLGAYLFPLILILLFNPPAWPQCTSCEECPPPAIAYSSLQMSSNEAQTLRASGGAGGYFWTLTGGGRLNGTEGGTITYTAPPSNPYCANNPTLTVTDACGRVASLSLAVNALPGNVAGYYASKTFADSAGYPVGNCATRMLGVCYYGIAKRYLLCNGNLGSMEVACSPGHSLYCTADEYWALGEDECEEERESCNLTACPDGCSEGLHDTRTGEQLSAGCCPAPLMACLKVNSFGSNSPTINLLGGQKANFTGEIFSQGTSSTSWTLTVAGRVFRGSGNSVSASWDGTNASGKQVVPGTYTATLEAEATGGSCNGRNSRSIPITITSIQPNVEPKLACFTNLEVPFGSTVNIASGNLDHSQTLFVLPRSKFLGSFVFSYNSLDGQTLPLGTGWRHTFYIILSPNNDGSYTLIDGNSQRMVLYRNGSGYTPERSSYPSLTLNADGTFTLERKEGIFYLFDQRGNIASISDRNSNTITFAYDSENNLIRVIDPSGRNILLEYDPNNRVRTITDPNGNVHSFAYTDQYLTSLSSQIQGLGVQSWSYSYDPNGFLLAKTDPQGYVTSYAYDQDYRVVQATDPEGKIRSLVYQPENFTSQLTEKDGGVWTYRYDPTMGALTTKIDPLGNTTQYAYDQNRNLSSMTDPRGNRTSFTYDDNGNMASLTNALGNITTYTYNSLNKVTSITYPGNAVLTLSYDARGNLIAVSDPLGSVTQYAYDSRGNLLSILNPLSQATTFTYDSHDYLTSLADPIGAVTSLAYDPGGRLIGYTDPQGNTTRFEFNGLNKITKVTDPQGFFLTYTYDPSGNVRSRTDANGVRTLYEYNDRGQVTKTTDALNNITQFTYGSGCPSCGTGVDKLTSLIDAKGQTTRFEYNLAGWLIRETTPLGFSKSYTYDPSGNRIARADENGSITQYSYDNLNQLTSIRYSNGDTTTFAYDSRGNMSSAANQNIGYAFSHDLNNRMINFLDSNGKSITYQYDALGNRNQLMTPDGRTVIYQYDAANRPTQILSQAGAFAFSYDLSGRRTGLTYPNGVTTTYAYNPSGFLTSLMAQTPQRTIINSFSYTHDAMGNRISMTDIFGSHDYTYDALYQLIQATHPKLPSQQFKYDALGNRLNRVVDADNRLLEDRGYTYRYDSNGNLIERVRKMTGVMTSYSFDGENKLTRIESPEKVVGIKYDAFGRRIEKDVNGRITRYVYDGANMVLEYGPNDRIKSRYIHSLKVDEPLALERGREVYYYHSDGLGSVRELTDDTGSIAKSYQYKSFGRIHSQTGTLHQPFTFTGREYDSESGLYYYRSRYYNPRTGRFLTKDPIGFAGGDVNLYRYVTNNPINFRDPSGFLAYPYHFWISLVAGLLEGRSMQESLEMANQSVAVDIGTQSTWAYDTVKHAQVGVDPKTGRIIEPHEAIMGAMQFSADQSACGNHGAAMHPLQDLQAFWHAGQRWKGNDPFANWDAIGHWLMDVVPSPDVLWDALRISRQYLRQQRR